MVTVHGGLARFQVYDIAGKKIKSDQDLFEHNNFLVLSNPPRGVSNVRLWEWIYDDPHDSTDKTRATIIAFGNNVVFYLCRELIRFELMYFILLKPRGQSSLCTPVYMFIRPAARLNQGENSLVPSANQSTLPNYTGQLTPGFGPKTPYQVFHSSSPWSNQLVGESSAPRIELDPQRQTSGSRVNIHTYPHYNALGAQNPYPPTRNTSQSRSEQYPRGYEVNAHDSTFVSTGYPKYPQKGSSNDHSNI
jgi:hypothetical protein